MNKQTAREKGLTFTGIYSRFKDEVQQRLDEIRKQGYKAYLVTEMDDPLSRGASFHNGRVVSRGYSVYVEERYQKDRTAEDMRRRINAYPASVERIMEECKAKVAELTNHKNEQLKWLSDNGYTL